MNRHLYDEEALMKDYPLAARTTHPGGTVIPVGSAAIGGENLTLIAGPCAVESREQLFATAAAVKAAGATILRGGTYKPRTSPMPLPAWGRKACAFWRKPAGNFSSPPSVKSPMPPFCPSLRKSIFCRWGPAICRIIPFCRHWAASPNPSC